MKPEGEENRATAGSYALDPMLPSNHARAKSKIEASHILCSGRNPADKLGVHGIQCRDVGKVEKKVEKLSKIANSLQVFLPLQHGT